MTGRQSALALALLLAAQPALTQERHAQPKGGSDGGSTGSHHPKPSSDASSVKNNGGSGGSGSSDASAAAPQTQAERRHPQPRPFYGSSHYGYYNTPYYYSSRFYYPYDFGFYGYSPYYYSGFYGYSPAYYSQYRYSYAVGSLRVLVEPPETRVYVDGYYAGIADDFDGLFQRLHVSPGRHDITLRLDGYQTQRLKVYVPVDDTLKIHQRMVRGSGEGPEETLGEPERYAPERYARDRDRDDDRDADLDADDRRGPLRDEPRAEHGTLHLDVRPADATVYVDGEFRGAARRASSLSLPPGRHRVEVVRPGYRTVEREVEVKAGHTEDVTIDLER